MSAKSASSFEELLKGYYGGGADRTSNSRKIEALLANYYGAGIRRKPRKPASSGSVAMSVDADNGEVLKQPTPGQQFPETKGTGTERFEEYVVNQSVKLATQSSLPASAPAATEPMPLQEYEVDILQPLGPADSAGTMPVAPVEPSLQSRPEYQPSPVKPAESPRPAAAAPSPVASQSTATDEDFMADMQSILTGQKVFDPLSKKTVEKEKLAQAAAGSASANPQGLPAPDAKNSQAIFDRIAQSMQYANAYDLGTVELANRFEDFDKVSDLKQKSAEQKKQKSATLPTSVVAKAASVDSADFLQDLDAIRKAQAANSECGCSPSGTANPPALAASQSTGEYSRPLYDTGEHVLTGGNLYPGRFRVGKPPGVLLSYGQIISMGDFFSAVEEMMAADSDELARLKSLIERSTEFYRKKSGPDVSNDEWDAATHGRYLRLAEENYEHFAPNTLFKDAAVAKTANRFGDNKSAWEFYHKRALDEARKLRQSAQPANGALFLEWPLIVNAFGDHFLTDAFAAGHVINKEVTIAFFKSNFFNGRSLKPEGKSFFEKVAANVFKGEVSKKFSALETTDYPVCKWGWCLRWHPNINSADRFSKVLIGAAEQEPDRVANFVVKALHDRLNKQGLEVTNNAGDGTWRLTGDSYLDDKNLKIMQKAVQQSVDNVNDPAVAAGAINVADFYDRVWRHVPQMTAASQKFVTSLVADYTSPTSGSLVTAAGDIIRKEVDALIRALLEQKKLKPA